ncbi:glycoside hydrolase family 3 protein [Streptomyces sp. NPDC006879]|uniref:glycoside hydrolase family 3 protein n=1 Tax=Streptomyces sp. NPDC006879 TaxID=3364767 RepID=UPI003679AE14
MLPPPVSASRRILLSAAALAAVTATTGPAGAAPRSGTEVLDRREQGRLRRLVAGMSLAEKVGQLFVTQVYGHSATAPDEADAQENLKLFGVRNAAELISRYHPGGIVYFSWARNTRDPRQIADLSHGIQCAGLGQPTPLPLLISVDQEHGTVARIGRPATLLPGAMALGAAGSPPTARGAARIAGSELAALGIHQDYAPVADVNVNPANPVIGVRSFGADPQAVATLVEAQVRGFWESGVAATAKHFPGHGDTETDSHVDLPVMLHSRQDWERLDAPPFRAAIAAGVGSVMTAHIVVPSLDPSGDPATLSHPIVTGILREQLGYRGVVTTDSLAMAGVRQKYGDDQVPVLALLAGCDQLLKPPDLRLAHDAVQQAVRRGELTEERIEESVLRILALKSRLGLFAAPLGTGGRVEGAVGSPEHLAAAERIADATVTLLANPEGLLPLSTARHPRLLVTGADPDSPTGTTGPPTSVLASELTRLGFVTRALSTGLEPGPGAIAQAVAAAGRCDVVLVCTYNVPEAGVEDPQRSLVESLLGTGVPVVVLAVRNPYDVGRLPKVAACLASYGWTDVELGAAARALAGVVTPAGRLPVKVPGAYPLGHGLTY